MAAHVQFKSFAVTSGEDQYIAIVLFWTAKLILPVVRYSKLQYQVGQATTISVVIVPFLNA